MAMQFFKRVCNVLDNESVPYEKPVLAKVIERHFPDFRRVLTELQTYSASGNIDEGIFVNLKQESKALAESLKAKDWKKMRQWVVNNVDTDPQGIFRQIYDILLPQVKSIPQLVLLIADYQYKAAFVADQEINLTACLTEIMVDVEFTK